MALGLEIKLKKKQKKKEWIGKMFAVVLAYTISLEFFVKYSGIETLIEWKFDLLNYERVKRGIMI